MRGGRKKIVLISLVAVFMFLGVFCYKTWLIAFVITRCLSGRTDGKQGIVRSIVLPWRSYRIHLHHWFLALILGGVFAINGFYILPPEVFYASVSAIVFQGIFCYGDWYRIIAKRGVLPAFEPHISLAAGDDSELRLVTPRAMVGNR